jgi:hypothetical protein
MILCEERGGITRMLPPRRECWTGAGEGCRAAREVWRLAGGGARGAERTAREGVG